MSAINRVVTLLAILESSAEDFWRLSAGLTQLIVKLGGNPGIDDMNVALGATWGELRREAERLELSVSVKQLERIKEHVDAAPMPYSTLLPMVVELHNRVLDELSNRIFISITPHDFKYYRPKEPLFGALVASKFPSKVAFEVDEAAKCLALGRSTASAFHSIRILEACIRAISRCLAIPDPTKGAERSWFKALQAIENEMDARWPKSGRLTGDGVLFETIHAALAAMQNPYRNSTMHLETIYTDDDARHLFEIVKGLMQRVANRMDEDGEPKA